MDKSAIGGFEASDTNRVISSTILRDAWDISAFASYHQKSDVPADNRRVEIRPLRIVSNIFYMKKISLIACNNGN